MIKDDIAFRCLRHHDQTQIDRKQHKVYNALICIRHQKGEDSVFAFACLG